MVYIDRSDLLGQKFLVWLGFTCFTSLICWLSFTRIYIRGHPSQTCWGRWLNFHHDPEDSRYYFQIKPVKMTPFARVYNWIQMMLHSLILFYYADVVGRIDIFGKDAWLQLVYPVITCSASGIFGFIGQIKGMNFTISPKSLKHLSLQAKIVLVLLVAMWGGLSSLCLHLAYGEGILGWYLGGVLWLPSIYLIMYWLYLEERTDPSWHIHHWFIGYYWCLVSRFDHWLVNVMFCIFYGVYLQGALSYGVTPILNPKEGGSKDMEDSKDIIAVQYL